MGDEATEKEMIHSWKTGSSGVTSTEGRKLLGGRCWHMGQDTSPGTRRGSTQGGIREPLWRLERVCVCVCVCAHTCACAYARDENEILGYFLIHHPARQESHIASGLGVSRLVKKVKPEFISVSVYIQTNLLLLCFTFLRFTDIGDFSFFPYWRFVTYMCCQMMASIFS